jgi:tetratricopeptide (TPR) repeat protein
MRDPSQLFQQAADLHLKGKLAMAEELYRELLTAQPGHVDALHFLGVLQYQQGRWNEALASIGAALSANPDFAPALVSCAAVLRALERPAEALARLDRALAIKPDYAEALYNRGLALGDLDRRAEALSSFDQALTVTPDSVEALLGRASALRRLDRPEEALASLDRALALRGDLPQAHVSRGNTLRDLDRPDAALASFERALAVKADHVEALVGRGSTLRKLGRGAEALASLDQALALRPRHADALIHRGNALQDLKRPADALASYEQALALRPGDADALINRGNALRNLDRPAEALASYEQALAITPRHAGALYNRGNALADLKRPADALASFDQALAVSPDYAQAHNNRAGVLKSLGRPTEALAGFERALAIEPNDAETRLNRSTALLLLGEFERGWQEYEWRWKTPHLAPSRRSFAQPLWLGEETLAGATILLHAEQGFGDAIQFVRYVPLVAARARKVILEVPPELKGLLARIEGASLVINRGETLPSFDCHCPLASLPLAFKTTLDTIPAAIPYLSAAEDRVAKWQARLAKSGRARIGLAWAGNPNFPGDRARSIGLARLAPLLTVPGVAFFGLQKDLRAGDRELLESHASLVHLGDAIEDFDDTAAILSLLDLVIASDTAIVHLAGALGKPVWVLLQRAADWRWLAQRADSPWYPTARLFRQPSLDDWDRVLEQVRAELMERRS